MRCMTNEEVFELVTELLAISPEAADRDDLHRAASLIAAVRSFTAHYEMRCSRRGDELNAHDRRPRRVRDDPQRVRLGS